VKAFALLVVSACGRIAFDPYADPPDATDASGGLASVDAVSPDGPSSDLLLHLAFESDGITVDRARGHSATCRGGCPSAIAGRIGAGAVAFNGTQCIEVPDAADLRPADITVSIWVYVTTPLADGEVFSRPQNGMTSGQNVLEVFAGANGTWTLIGGTKTLARQVSPNTWHHISLTVESTIFTLYIDGTAMGTSSPTALNYASDPYLIGCEIDNNVENVPLRGRVDDVRIYGRALTAQEIAALAAM
jgi:hypothetical protein